MVARGLALAAVMVGAGLAGGAPFSPTEARAQSDFGQNQVQYKTFDWQILATEHFLIYFYPEERVAAHDAGRMAERSYARLSRVFAHEFTEKKPIVLFASRADFGQNNVTGDLGEGTGGVTEALRHRMLLNFTGDYGSFQHVLAHEMTHAFQYDIFAHGKAGNGMQALAEHTPPLWFAEGMAEYLSLGPSTPLTDAWMRDAALNGRIPTVAQMTDEPDKFFPYRFGQSFWAYVGRRWGDEAIGLIMSTVPTLGVERAFKRALGEDLDDIGDEWREDLQTRLLPSVGSLDRPRSFAQSLLTAKASGGQIFLAPALSPDGRSIAFLSNGSVARGQVFIDLWLGDAETGKRVDRLVSSMTNPNFVELGILFSQSAFSPDGGRLAFTAQKDGKDEINIMDLKSRAVTRLSLPLGSCMGPSWSPDGTRLVFSGSNGGLTDLYIVTIADSHLERLTDDRYGDQQPQWSPDGRTIAFATDRGDSTSLALLHFTGWRIALYDLASRAITVLPGQSGLNLNPQWAPDGRSLAYVSDRTGIANVFLFDLEEQRHYQLTNVLGAVSAITEYSPAISWARDADRLAFTYYDNGEYTIWTVGNPRQLKRRPFVDLTHRMAEPVRLPDSLVTRVVAAGSDTALTPVSVAALLDSVSLGLPDTNAFRIEPMRVRFQPDYVARPSISYAPDSYGRSVFGGTSVVMSDLLGNHHLTMEAEINGRLSESRLLVGYTNLTHRLQYSVGLSQAPYYFLTSDSLVPTLDSQLSIEHQEITIYVARQAYAVATYPLSRFARVELGGGLNSVGRHLWFFDRDIDSGSAGAFNVDSIRPEASLNYFDGQLAYVSDNAVMGSTGPIMGHRYRVGVSPVFGSLKWMEYLLDYRRYDPIIFNNLTVATRVYANIAVGPDETAFPKYIARPDFVRGYDRNNSFYLPCPVLGANTSNCNQVELLGSRVTVANLELRFPLIRQLELGVLPVTLPPLDGLFFYDAGVAWSKGQTVSLSRPTPFDATSQRYPLRSYGFGLRLNILSYAVLRWDYAKPVDQTHKGFWTWSLWPSY